MKLFQTILAIMFLTGFAIVANAQKTYWLGTKEGNKLVFKIQVPADAAAAIMNKTKPAEGGANTTPRYQTFTKDGVVFHQNELGWETPKLNDGGLSFVVDAGVGEDWKECDPQNPLWNNFANALANLSSPYGSNGWSQAKVVMAESNGKNAPSIQLDLTANTGGNSAGNSNGNSSGNNTAPAAVPAAPGSKRCAGVTTPLTDAEIDDIIRVHNETRAEVGTAPLKWNCNLAKIAQEWANNDVFEHRKDLDKIIPGIWAGENLSADANPTTSAADMLKGWIEEKAFWNNDAKTCEAGKVCGHYTQMVWKTTTEVGCGIIRNGNVMGPEWKDQSTYLVCNYSPGGNDGGAAW